MARAVGVKFEIENLDSMLRGISKGADILPDVKREILRGPFGRALLREIKARTSDHIRSGYTIGRIRVADDVKDGVSVGIPQNDTSQHPHSKRANAKSIGVWLESGVRMHLIPTKVSRLRRLSFNGRIVSQVTHPGFRGSGIMKKTLKAYRSDMEKLIVQELERRMTEPMGLK